VNWVEPRTLPCLGHDCPHCAAGLRQRWKGYEPALLWSHATTKAKGTWKPIVREITEGADQQLAGYEARSLVVELSRPGRRNGPLQRTPLEQPCADPLPDTFDVRPILMRL
jgi:hypothetical protein